MTVAGLGQRFHWRSEAASLRGAELRSPVAQIEGFCGDGSRTLRSG